MPAHRFSELGRGGHVCGSTHIGACAASSMSATETGLATLVQCRRLVSVVVITVLDTIIRGVLHAVGTAAHSWVTGWLDLVGTGVNQFTLSTRATIVV
ncbi:hypothetical protein RRF57_011596 [Xylaria bambusicola]|uniref:Uncharacterized protein n=1 Tax=Xylaria bambusicola TaxID=326684 RepID=A0AAN7V4R8_9PEZI